MSREPGHIYGVPVRGVIDSEDEVNHRFLGGRIPILLKDSRTVGEGVPDWSVEFRDDRFQERPGRIRYWEELILAERRGQMRQVGIPTMFQSSRRWIQAACSQFLRGRQRWWRWWGGLGGRVGDWFCGEGATEETSVVRRAEDASDNHLC